MNTLPDDQMLKLAAQSMFDVFASTAMGSMLVDRQHRIVWISESYKQFLPALGFDSARPVRRQAGRGGGAEHADERR